MHHKTWLGIPRAIAVAFLGTLAIIAACQDTNAPQPQDEWATRAVDNVYIRNQATLFGPDGTALMSPSLQQGRASQHPLPVVDVPLNRGNNESHVRLAHLRSKEGDLITNAFVYAGVKQPPRRVYGFKNGRVQYLFEPEYKKTGRSWKRHSARVSLYDDAGKVTAQYESREISGVVPANLTAPAAPVGLAADVLSTDGLVNDEVEGACWKEFRDNLIAYGVWIAATGVATQAWLLCPVTGPAAEVTCTAAIAASAAALAAFGKYMDTMDALTHCEMSKWIAETNSSGVPPDRSTETTVAKDLMAVIQDFMRQAIAAGTVRCNSDRSYCVYTGANLL